MINKKNFPTLLRVRFVNTSDPELEQISGTILGKTVEWPGTGWGDVYGVLLDRPHSARPNDLICAITEACLEPHVAYADAITGIQLLGMYECQVFIRKPR